MAHNGYLASAGELIDDFEDAALWTGSGTVGGAKAADTTTKRAGSQSVRVDLSDTTASNYSITKTVDLDISAGGTILFWADVEDPNRIANLGVYLATDGAFSKFYVGTINVAGVRAAGTTLFAIDISEMSASGGITLADQITRVRLRANSHSGGIGGGSIAFDSLYYRRTARPKILVVFDDGYDNLYSTAYPYMASKGMLGTSYVISDEVGEAGFMTLANLQELHSAGWAISAHTKTHTGFNRGGDTAVCASQTPTAASGFTIDGTKASGGVATLDDPRHLIFRTAGNEYGKSVTITGTSDGSTPLEETIWLRNASWWATEGTFETVTGIAISANAAGAITVGQSQSLADIATELSVCKAYLESNGLPGATSHFAYPYGEFNRTALDELASQGFSTARNSSIDLVYTAFGDLYGQQYQLTCIQPTNSTTVAAITAFVDDAILRGATGIINFHNIVETESLSTDFATADFEDVIDYIAGRKDAGVCEVLTISSWFDGL